MKDVLTIDFETYYDRDYSLKKLTTEEYIRDDRFEIIGLSTKLNSDPAIWLSGETEDIKEYLATEYDWDNIILLAHNTSFDGAILNWKLGIRPSIYLDTICIALGLNQGSPIGYSLAQLCERYGVEGEKGTEVLNAIGKRRKDFTIKELSAYGDYCVNDVELTYMLFKRMARSYPKKELKVIDLTLRAFIEPVLELDTKLLNKHLKKIRKAKQETLDKLGIAKENLMSNPKFAKVLQELGVDPPTKISLRTEQETWAFSKTDKEFIELLEHPNLDVQAVVAARLKHKSTIEETRTERFLDISRRGSLPIPLKYYAAHTGRWGGQDKVNIQNLPSRGESKILKESIIAPKGYSIIETDSAQIEARILAWVAGQENLTQAFSEGRDVYKQMASSIYKKKEKHITAEERFIGKSVILGAGYGMGWERFSNQIRALSGIEIEELDARNIIKVYRKENPKITMFWRQAQSLLAAMCAHNKGTVLIGEGYELKTFLMRNAIMLPSGLPLVYENLKCEREDGGEYQYLYFSRKDNSWIKIYGGKVVENLCQALARCVIAEQMLAIDKKYRVVLTVHDSIVCCVKDNKIKEATKYIYECMRKPPEWASGLPLNCDIHVGKSYGNCKEWDINKIMGSDTPKTINDL